MTGRLTGRKILVTGGGSGIGRAAVERYSALGAEVTVVEFSHDRVREMEDSDIPRVTVIQGDALDSGVLTEAVGAACGDEGLDNLTCCVGVFDFYASLSDLSMEQLQAAALETWQKNVMSILIAVRASLDKLRRGQGSVTLTVSESAFYPVGGGPLYGSSKWAVRGLVSHLAKDLAPDIRVNGVAPGGTSGTRFGGLISLEQTQTADAVEGRDDRIAQSTLLRFAPSADDHAEAFAFLADSAAARAITGTIINSDAGRSM